MNGWRPDLATFLAAMREPVGWGVDLNELPVGIDNAHVDCYLSPEFREAAGAIIVRLRDEEAAVTQGGTPPAAVDDADLQRFGRACQALFEAAAQQRGRGVAVIDRLVLLQLALLKWLLQASTAAVQTLREDYQRAGQATVVRDSGRNLELHETLVLLTRQAPVMTRRVLQRLLRQWQRVDSGELGRLRGALSTAAWPLPRGALFNPVLLAPELARVDELAADYPIVLLSEGSDDSWLAQANAALVDALGTYLPDAYRRAANPKALATTAADGLERRQDQGLLPGYLTTELALSGFLASEEYRGGCSCWLDEPENLRRLLSLPDATPHVRQLLLPTAWTTPAWTRFRGELRALLHRRLEHWGLGDRIVLAYWLPALRAHCSSALPLALVADYCRGLLPKRRLPQRLAALDAGTDGSTLSAALPVLGARPA